MTVVHPVAGGFGATAHAYLGPIGGWFMRWNVAVVMCIAVGVEVVATGKYLHWFFPGLGVEAGTVLSSLVIVAINLATVKAYGQSEYWFSIIKVAMVVAFIILGTILIFFGIPSVPRVGLGNFTGWILLLTTRAAAGPPIARTKSTAQPSTASTRGPIRSSSGSEWTPFSSLWLSKRTASRKR